MLTLTLLLLAAEPVDDAQLFAEKAPPSTIKVVGSGWFITNVTYDGQWLQWKGDHRPAVVRRTETLSFERGSNERNRDFLVEVMFDFEKKPSLRFKASGEELVIESTHYVTRTAMSIENTWELFDLETQKRFLVAAEEYQRVSLPGVRGEDAFLGYEKLEKQDGVHGRLVLTTRKGVKSEVTFAQKNKVAGKVLHWAPKLTVDEKRVTLSFQSDTPHVVDVPITNGKLNGKDQSVLDLP